MSGTLHPERQDRRFVRLEGKVGLFVAVSALLVATIFGFVALKTGFFTPRTLLAIHSPSGEGIHAGMPVKLSGFVVGHVDGMELVSDPGQGAGEAGKAPLTIRVDLKIDTEYLQWIRADSTALLRAEGVVGDTIIELFPGTPQAPPLKPHDVIPFARQKSITDYVGDITSAVERIQDRALVFLDDANDPEGDVRQSLLRLRRLLEGIEGTRDRLTSLLANLDRLVVHVDETSRDLFTRMDDTLVKVQGVLDDGKRLTETLVEQTPELLDKGTAAADSALAVTESARQVWPLSAHDVPPEPTPLPVTSE